MVINIKIFEEERSIELLEILGLKSIRKYIIMSEENIIQEFVLVIAWLRVQLTINLTSGN